MPLLQELIGDLVIMGWDRKYRQVKEKMGGSRFYIPVNNEKFKDRIYKAEELSLTICEYCGDVGSLKNTTMGLKTLCEKFV